MGSMLLMSYKIMSVVIFFPNGAVAVSHPMPNFCVVLCTFHKRLTFIIVIYLFFPEKCIMNFSLNLCEERSYAQCARTHTHRLCTFRDTIFGLMGIHLRGIAIASNIPAAVNLSSETFSLRFSSKQKCPYFHLANEKRAQNAFLIVPLTFFHFFFCFCFVLFIYLFLFIIFNCFCSMISYLVASYFSFFIHFSSFFCKLWERCKRQTYAFARLNSRHCMTTYTSILNFFHVCCFPLPSIENSFPFTCSQFQTQACNCVSFVCIHIQNEDTLSWIL